MILQLRFKNCWITTDFLLVTIRLDFGNDYFTFQYLFAWISCHYSIRYYSLCVDDYRT